MYMHVHNTKFNVAKYCSNRRKTEHVFEIVPNNDYDWPIAWRISAACCSSSDWIPDAFIAMNSDSVSPLVQSCHASSCVLHTVPMYGSTSQVTSSIPQFWELHKLELVELYTLQFDMFVNVGVWTNKNYINKTHIHLLVLKPSCYTHVQHMYERNS